MTTYWLTFRLHKASLAGRSYEQRYDALYATLDKLATTSWADPTSFIAFESQHSISQLAAALKRVIVTPHDLVLIREMDTKRALIVGQPEGDSIFDLMPYLKKL